MVGKRDPYLGNQINLGITGRLQPDDPLQTVVNAGGVPVPVMHFKPANRVYVRISDNWTGDGMTARQLFTVPAGKLLLVTSFQFICNAAYAILRDGTVDGGAVVIMSPGTAGVNWNGYALSFNDEPMVISDGIRCDIADNGADSELAIIVCGFLVDKDAINLPQITDNGDW